MANENTVIVKIVELSLSATKKSVQLKDSVGNRYHYPLKSVASSLGFTPDTKDGAPELAIQLKAKDPNLTFPFWGVVKDITYNELETVKDDNGNEIRKVKLQDDGKTPVTFTRSEITALFTREEQAIEEKVASQLIEEKANHKVALLRAQNAAEIAALGVSASAIPTSIEMPSFADPVE